MTFFAGDSWLRHRAVETVREILSDPAVRIIRKAMNPSCPDFYAARLDKGYSLTDCIFDANDAPGRADPCSD